MVKEIFYNNLIINVNETLMVWQANGPIAGFMLETNYPKISP